MMFDFSVRGWNRRPPNSNFLAWNGGDAVGQIFLKLVENEKSTFGLSAGVRSLYEGSGSGGSTSLGEGISGGLTPFRCSSQKHALHLIKFSILDRESS